MKKLLVLVFAIALCLGVLCVGASADYSGAPETPDGTGTVNNPYKIGTAEELYWFAQTVNGGDYDAHAKLTADITINTGVLNADGTLNGTPTYTWTPIGEYVKGGEKAYTGTFDGQDHTISGLYYSVGGEGYKCVGLFGYVGSEGWVQNVNIADSYISNNGAAGDFGGVCGCNNGGTITNCSFSGSVTCNNSNTHVGGVCGWNAGTTENCYNAGTVTSVGSKASVGGVCGYNGNGSTIRNCYNTGAVNGKNTGDGYFYVGGVCGYNVSFGLQSTITNCYNTGSVTVSGSGTNYVGGVCGLASSATITNCYNIGEVSGTTAGGVCGWNTDGTIKNCYWLSGTATIGIGTGTGEATSKTTTEFTSGEVAWLLNQGQTNGPWRQNLSDERDDYPVLDSTHEEVVKLTVDEDDVSYHNKGYSFSGETNKAYFKADVAIKLPYTVNVDTELTSAAIYTVTVVYDNGTADTKEQVVDGKSFKLPTAPSKSGYTFVGWSDGNETYDPSQDVTVTGDKTFTAVWKQLFTVTVVYDNGTADTKERWSTAAASSSPPRRASPATPLSAGATAARHMSLART